MNLCIQFLWIFKNELNFRLKWKSFQHKKMLKYFTNSSDPFRIQNASVIVITPWGNGEKLSTATHFFRALIRTKVYVLRTKCGTTFDVIVLINCLVQRFYEIRNDMCFLHSIRKLLTAVCFCRLCKWNMQSQLICLAFVVVVHRQSVGYLVGGWCMWERMNEYVSVCNRVNSPRCD